MNKMIITVFDSEEKAFKGITALKNLDNNGDISIYATAIITKNEFGEVKLKDASDQGIIGTAVGMFTGSLIGMLAGPVGLAIGATTGMFGGMIYDLDTASVDSQFVDEISNALEKGKTAVIIDAEEEWKTPVDTTIEGVGGLVFRRNRYEVENDQYNREVEELNLEFLELKQEMRDSNDEFKADIQKHIDENKKKREAMKVAINKKRDKYKAESKARVDKLNQQISNAGDRRKKKLNARKEKLEKKIETSNEKLDAMSRKASEYLL